MKDDGSTKDDVKIPDGELGNKIKENFASGKDTSKSPAADIWSESRNRLIYSPDVIVLSAMGEESAIDTKTVGSAD